MQKIKEEIVKISQRMYHEGLVAATSGNISCYDRASGKVAITPSSIAYDDLTAESITVIDMNGNVVEGPYAPSSEWQMHLRVYEKMDDVNAVVHTHSTFATAFAVIREPVDKILIEMDAYLGGAIPLAGFAEPGSIELGDAVVEGLQHNRTSCLLSNHGALAVGEDLEDAYTKAVYVEDAAKIYYNARNIGTPVIL